MRGLPEGEPAEAPPRGRTFIDSLLTLSVVAVAVITAAHVFLPDFQRGVRLLAREIEERVTGW